MPHWEDGFVTIRGGRGLTRYAKVLPAVFLLLPFAAFACASIPSSASSESESCLRIGFLEKADSLNPIEGQTPASKVFCSLVYDCLQGVGEDLEAVPNLALDWRIAEEFEPYGSVWDFDLTKNAYWHDDMPLTTKDVVFTINVMAGYFVQMQAYNPYAHFIDYAENVSDNVVRIHFYDRDSGEPMPAAYTSSLHIPIFPKHIFEKWLIGAWSWFGAEWSPIGSGPFMVTDNITEEFTAGNKITLIKNPDYHWKKDKGLEVQLDKIEMKFFEDGTALAEELENGTVDVAQLPREDYLAMKERVESGQLENTAMFDGQNPNQQCTYIVLNAGLSGPNPSIVDPAIRQALSMATDKQYIVENHYLGLANEANTLIPSINEYWHCELTEEELYEYDLDHAAQILEDAGYRYVSNPEIRTATADSYAVLAGFVTEGTLLRYHLSINEKYPYPEERQIVLYLQEKWGDIGIDIEYDVVSDYSLPNMLCPYELDMWFWRGQADVDPQAILYTESSQSWGGWGENMYSDPDYEKNFSLSIQSLYSNQRREYVHNCQRIQYEDVSCIMLGELFQTYAWRTDNLTGWGDWAAHPGRSIDATWTGNILYFELEPAEDDYMTILALAAIAAATAAAATVVVVRYRRKG